MITVHYEYVWPFFDAYLRRYHVLSGLEVRWDTAFSIGLHPTFGYFVLTGLEESDEFYS
jgi:hypothetical protein